MAGVQEPTTEEEIEHYYPRSFLDDIFDCLEHHIIEQSSRERAKVTVEAYRDVLLLLYKHNVTVDDCWRQKIRKTEPI